MLELEDLGSALQADLLEAYFKKANHARVVQEIEAHEDMSLRSKYVQFLCKDATARLANNLIKKWNLDMSMFTKLKGIQVTKSFCYYYFASSLPKDVLVDLMAGYPEFLSKLSERLFQDDHLIEAGVAYLAFKLCPDHETYVPENLHINDLENLVKSDTFKRDHEEYIKAQNAAVFDMGRESWGDSEDDYSHLHLSRDLAIYPSNVVWIDDLVDLKKTVTILRENPYVTFDCEWRPRLSTTVPCTNISLLQIAVPRCATVYLIDMLTLGGGNAVKVQNDEADKIISEFFGAERPYKIGLGVHNDASMFRHRHSQLYEHLELTDLRFICSSNPDVRQLIENSECDLRNSTRSGNNRSHRPPIATSLNQPMGASFGHSASVSNTSINIPDEVLTETYVSGADAPSRPPRQFNNLSLSLMAKVFLGYELDKSFQIVNWDKRPLCMDHVKYAVTDAACVNAIIRTMMDKLGIKEIEELLVPR